MSTIIPNRELAYELLTEFNKNESLIRHALAVEAVMQHFAEILKEDDKEKWGIVGLLHDIDFELFPEEHCIKVREILKERNWPEDYIRAVESHGWGICTDVKPEEKMEKVLYTIDELTGLITATALLRPSKSIIDLEVKSVKKKWKQKGFAAGVNREVIEAGAEMLSMDLDLIIDETIKGMQKAAEIIGLKGENLSQNQVNDPELWFVFESNKLLVKIIDSNVYIPTFEEISLLTNNLDGNKYSIGNLSGYSCFAARYKVNTELPDGFAFKELRRLLGKIDENIFQIAGRAIQILEWADTHKYCGSCGTPTNIKEDEFARVCPACGHMCFPRISPAIIVAITKENKILLARNKNFTNFYSVIAGFVEPGETLEECIKREVKEEIGLEVKNVKYFGSQPWPFPNTLMIAFTAEYESGEIILDENELAEADWFTVHNLPQIPTKVSIAGQLINWFIENNND